MPLTLSGSNGVAGVDGSAGTPALQGSDSNTGIAFGADTIIGSTGGSERFRVDSSGRLGIGTTSATAQLQVNSGSSPTVARFDTSSALGSYVRFAKSGTDGQYLGYGADILTGASGDDFAIRSAGAIKLGTNGDNLRCTIDTSGRLLVGTSSAYDASTVLQVKGASGFNGGYLDLQSSWRSTITNQGIGHIRFIDGEGGYRASIECRSDGDSSSASDVPARLMFSTTADGASSPTERVRINNKGAFMAAIGSADYATTDDHHQFFSNQNNYGVRIYMSNTSRTAENLRLNAVQSASSGWFFSRWYSGDGSSGSADLEFQFTGNGNGSCDGSFTGGGADYAEYFEWSDSNPDEEDRRGISVVLDGDKIREAVAGEDPIGVISGNPSVVGDAAWNKWSGKYLRDEFGTYIQEDYEVINDEGEPVVQQRRKLNPAYDPDQEYIPREQRPEWDCVGLMGKLRIRKGQITGSRWIKMRDISDSVEEWLVR